jgi:hypothetical protein
MVIVTCPIVVQPVLYRSTREARTSCESTKQPVSANRFGVIHNREDSSDSSETDMSLRALLVLR